MNSIIRERFPIFELYQALRVQLMDILSDEDLQFSPGGGNPTFGELCRTIGETERSYVDSFGTFEHDFSHRNEEEGLAGSVERLRAWFESLDRELKAAVGGLTEEDLETKTIDRGGGFVLPPAIQLEVYKEALLIFYGKASVYLKALGRTEPEQWRQWIA
ncbi:MAG: DinB family protein [Candidatus Bipolaricaulia bacterium]